MGEGAARINTGAFIHGHITNIRLNLYRRSRRMSVNKDSVTQPVEVNIRMKMTDPKHGSFVFQGIFLPEVESGMRKNIAKRLVVVG